MTLAPADRPDLDPNDPPDAMLLAVMRRACRPVAEGVLALLDDHGAGATAGGTLVVRGVLAAEPRIPGAVGAWLDTLPRDRPVLVPAVTSGRLGGMLERRGFRPTVWFDPDVGTFDNGAMVRSPG